MHRGDTIHDFRGDPATFISATRPTVRGKAGKVLVAYFADNDGTHPANTRELYATVFDLTVLEIPA